MGHLYDVVAEIDRICDSRGLDPVKTKGEISMRAGFYLAVIFPRTPDDPEKLARLRVAAQEVLGVSAPEVQPSRFRSSSSSAAGFLAL